MRLDWGDLKDDENVKKGRPGFSQVAKIFGQAYYSEPSAIYPGQMRAVGFVGEVLITVAYEYREDEDGEYTWLITCWKSTVEERLKYENKSRK